MRKREVWPMPTTAINLASATPLDSPSNLSEVTLAGKSGLTAQEAQSRLETVGPNSMPSTAVHPLRRMIDKLWAPVPWMLEAAIVLQLVLHKVTEAAVIAFLLFFNAALGFLQEGKAQATLAALRSRLALSAPVQRDGAWKVVPLQSAPDAERGRRSHDLRTFQPCGRSSRTPSPSHTFPREKYLRIRRTAPGAHSSEAGQENRSARPALLHEPQCWL